MANSERAGLPADPSILVDLDRLIGAYHDTRPDPSDPAQRVAFGTSGHRGSSFNGAFNEAHIVATTEAICRYRATQGTDGPLYIGRDTHALSEPAFQTALEVLAANGRQQRQHRGVQDIPGADLLLDHVEAGLFDVHGVSVLGESLGGRAVQDAPNPSFYEVLSFQSVEMGACGVFSRFLLRATQFVRRSM